MMRITVFLLSLLATGNAFSNPASLHAFRNGAATAATKTTTTTTTTTPVVQNSKNIVVRSYDVSQHAVSDMVDIVLPSALFLAALGATVVKSDDNDVSTTPAPTPVVEEPAVEETTPEVSEVETPTPEPVPEPVVAAAEVSTPSPSGKDISALRLEVASTKQGEEEKMGRLSASSEPDEDTSSEPSEPAAASTTETTTTTSRTLLQKILRVLKKVIAPWRKWSNIA